MSLSSARAFARTGRRRLTQDQQQRNLLLAWALFGAVVLAASLLSPYFLTARNLSNVVSQSVALLLVSIGQTFLMLSGGIDFSVGSTIGLIATLLALTVTPDLGSIVLSVALAAIVGGVVGLTNGLAITRLRVLPFIATLATLSIVQGIALQLRSTPPAILPREYSAPFMGQVGPVAMPLVILVASVAAAGLVLRHSSFGRHLYAIGSNEEAARLSGLAVNRERITAYVISGPMAGLAGAFLLARSRAADPLLGETFAFDSVTAVVMGGVNMFGGRGSIYGTVAAVLIIAVLANLLNLMGMSSHLQYLMKGGLLIGAVMLYRERR